jgi:hypothetical protein
MALPSFTERARRTGCGLPPLPPPAIFSRDGAFCGWEEEKEVDDGVLAGCGDVSVEEGEDEDDGGEPDTADGISSSSPGSQSPDVSEKKLSRPLV